MWFVSCHSFWDWFGLFPLFCLIVILFPKVRVRLLLLFLYATEVLLSYKCRFVSTFEKLLLQQATFKAFKVFFFFLFSMRLTSQMFIFILTSPWLQTHPHFVFECSSMFICFYWFLQSDLSMVIMVFDFCSIIKHEERKTFLDDIKVVVSK